MFCPNCGNQVADNTAVCPSCGAAVVSSGETETPRIPETQDGRHDSNLSYMQYGVTMLPPYSGLSIAGFVLSFFVPLIGLILSIVGLNDCSKTWKRGKGLAIAGTVISAIGLFFGAVYAIMLIAVLVEMY